jgi:hypothetical protein
MLQGFRSGITLIAWSKTLVLACKLHTSMYFRKCGYPIPTVVFSCWTWPSSPFFMPKKSQENSAEFWSLVLQDIRKCLAVKSPSWALDFYNGSLFLWIQIQPTLKIWYTKLEVRISIPNNYRWKTNTFDIVWLFCGWETLFAPTGFLFSYFSWVNMDTRSSL